MSNTINRFGFEDDYFYYHISYIGGSIVTPEPRSFRGVYHVRDISYVQLCTGEYGTMLYVNVYGEISRDDISVKSFYLDDFKDKRAYYDTLVHNINTRIKNYNKAKEDASNSFVGKFFSISLILFILFMVYLCGIS
jgi:hypothetical protein|nr:MAG TPA: hypothetical protein [Bacteriophage sp.]